jgi:hypothetical protein
MKTFELYFDKSYGAELIDKIQAAIAPTIEKLVNEKLDTLSVELDNCISHRWRVGNVECTSFDYSGHPEPLFMLLNIVCARDQVLECMAIIAPEERILKEAAHMRGHVDRLVSKKGNGSIVERIAPESISRWGR